MTAMKITIVGASETFARSIADWAVAAKHNVTIVGPSRAQAEAFVPKLGAGRAVGPDAKLSTKIVFAALPYVCLLDVWNSYGEELDGKVLVVLGADQRVIKKLSEERPAVRVLGLRIADATSGVFLDGDDAEAKELIARLFQDRLAPAPV